MSVYLIEATKQHICHGCGKYIFVGDKTVKTVKKNSTCSNTEIDSAYLHERCWPPKNKRGGK